MMRFFARASGLTKLAERYPANHQPEGQKYTKQTLQIGAVRFRKSVTVYINPEGLYVWAHPIFSNYPPIFIPWSEVKRTQESSIYGGRAMLLSIGDPQMGTIRVKMGLFRLIETHLKD
jgi:hypothetical protein